MDYEASLFESDGFWGWEIAIDGRLKYKSLKMFRSELGALVDIEFLFCMMSKMELGPTWSRIK